MLACIPLGELFFFHMILIRKVSHQEPFHGALVSHRELGARDLIFENIYRWGWIVNFILFWLLTKFKKREH